MNLQRGQRLDKDEMDNVIQLCANADMIESLSEKLEQKDAEMKQMSQVSVFLTFVIASVDTYLNQFGTQAGVGLRGS